MQRKRMHCMYVCVFTEAIDEMWAAQQRHLECIQDPPDMNMYRVARTTTIHGVDVPYYKCLRGSNSLEGFYKAQPNMIPGPHSAARPYQVYLISDIARWNSDRNSDAVFGGKGRHHRTYSAPLIDRLNTCCQQLFDETVEENFRAPADIPFIELLGLEYLFSQSTGESFCLQDIIDDGPRLEEVVQPGQADPDEHDEAYQSDTEARDDVLDAVLPHITRTSDETATIHPPAFVSICVSARMKWFLEKNTQKKRTRNAFELTTFIKKINKFFRKMPAVHTLSQAFRSWRSSGRCW
ncbi:uncharacterized protein LOC143488628 [Brachyhypopomus gauderio]|uniref:uncharacterized protein LOC143488628 n=1 Tax=Brachyhypopomus gauderio TaxID=698409 RepID=UPI004041D84D